MQQNRSYKDAEETGESVLCKRAKAACLACAAQRRHSGVTPPRTPIWLLAKTAEKEEPKRNTDTRPNKPDYIFTRNEKQWYSGSSIPNVTKLEKISTFRPSLVFSSGGWGYNTHVCNRKWSGWVIWLHELYIPTTFYHQPFETPNVAPTRGLVTSKPSALPYPWKINIFESSDYISRDIPSHKNANSCDFSFLLVPLLL